MSQGIQPPLETENGTALSLQPARKQRPQSYNSKELESANSPNEQGNEFFLPPERSAA